MKAKTALGLGYIKSLVDLLYTEWHKNLARITSSNIDQFANFFHCQNLNKICNNTIPKDPTAPQVCRYNNL